MCLLHRKCLVLVLTASQVLIALWTFLIVKLAGVTSTAEEEDEPDIIMQIKNPMDDFGDKIDDEESDEELDSRPPKALLTDIEEQDVGFNARPPDD